MTPDSTLAYSVTGMSCSHCKQAVTERIQSVPGVEEVEIDLPTGKVTVEGHEVDDLAIRAAIREAGYEIDV